MDGKPEPKAWRTVGLMGQVEARPGLDILEGRHISPPQISSLWQKLFSVLRVGSKMKFYG